MAGAARPDDRPVSPHLQIWRWHITMASSILHRASGLALYGAAFVFAIWLMLIAAGPDAYALAGFWLAHPIGQVGLYLVVAALAYHLANGLRHLVFDTGAGLKPAEANLSAWLAILFAVAAPIALWVLINIGSLR
jgi:succinate dehydrogenase / fumarate reductase cytochrome b subunit